MGKNYKTLKLVLKHHFETIKETILILVYFWTLHYNNIIKNYHNFIICGFVFRLKKKLPKLISFPLLIDLLPSFSEFIAF